MRVIYDFGLGHSTIRQSSAAPGSGRETVLVIARRDGAESGGSAVPSPLSGGIAQGDSVRVSPEALARSREVEAHEKSHLALLGGVASSPIMYDTARGPNGEAIKVGGSVKVDMAEVPGDPEATLRKAHAIIAAANAPNDPSAADARTAARAYQMAGKAQEEIDRERGATVNALR